MKFTPKHSLLIETYTDSRKAEKLQWISEQSNTPLFTVITHTNAEYILTYILTNPDRALPRYCATVTWHRWKSVENNNLFYNMSVYWHPRYTAASCGEQRCYVGVGQCRFSFSYLSSTVISGYMSPRHGASSGWEWRNGLQYGGQLRIADQGWSSTSGVGLVLTTPHRKNVSCYETFIKQTSDLDWYFGTN